jgi:hypothetical protein
MDSWVKSRKPPDLPPSAQVAPSDSTSVFNFPGTSAMAIEVGEVAHPHWHYFGVLEDDLLAAARYVDFSERNFPTYSIEFAHLLFAASAEVEVVFKKLCDLHAPNAVKKNMDHFRVALREPTHFHRASVFVSRFQMKLHPWQNWRSAKNPDWWQSYNAVKHERHTSFEQATLEAALKSTAGLFLAVLELSRFRVDSGEKRVLSTMDIMGSMMDPPSRLFAFGGWSPEVTLSPEKSKRSKTQAVPTQSGRS